MATNHVSPGCGEPDFHRTSLLGLLFFMLGAPNLYAFLKRRSETPKPDRSSRYAWMALAAMAIASLLEMSLV
jgi:putative Mn2+ efflux pump MntP